MPGEGRWETALLADGNIGIGGHPARLLRRVHDAARATAARVVADLAPYGTGLRTATVDAANPHRQCSRRLPLDGRRGRGDRAPSPHAAGLVVEATHEYAGRWFAVLGRES